MEITSDEAYYLLRVLEDEISVNGKVELLKDFLEIQFMKDIINLAYNPFIRFRLKSESLLGVTGQGSGELSLDDLQIFEHMAEGKLSGNEAKDEATRVIAELTEESAWLFKDILDKDLKCNIGAKLVNKAVPEFLPETLYMRCCLPKHVKNFDWGGAVIQEKADGMFVNITAHPGRITFTSRNGQFFPEHAFSHIANDLLPHCHNTAFQIHGEMLVTYNGHILDRKTGNGVLNSLLKKAEEPPEGIKCVYFAWDMIPYHALKSKEDTTPYILRFGKLFDIAKSSRYINLIPYEIISSEEEAMDFFKQMLVANKEGAIVKEADAIWRNGTSKQQFKLKAEKDCDLKIVGFKPGKGKNKKTFGSIRCESKDALLEVFVSGFTDTMRKMIWEDRNRYLGKIITVKFNEVIDSKTSDKYSLFLPRFVEIREDKTEADTLDKIQGA